MQAVGAQQLLYTGGREVGAQRAMDSLWHTEQT